MRLAPCTRNPSWPGDTTLPTKRPEIRLQSPFRAALQLLAGEVARALTNPSHFPP